MPGRHLIHIHPAAALVVVCVSMACGSSSQTITSPGATRCALQLHTETSTFSPEGGSGVLRISAARECSWTAQSQVSWVTFSSAAAGQGDGTVHFTVGANADPSVRNGTVAANDTTLQISQAGSPCQHRLSSTHEAVDAGGGDRTVRVTSTSEQCDWTASSAVPWIDIVSGREGRGSGDVIFRVSGIGDLPRSGAITIAGQVVHVEQATGCSYAVDGTTFSFGTAGGPGQLTLSAPPGCAWRAESQAPWLTITSGESGSGPGLVAFHVSASSGAERTGTLVVAGRIVTVTQSSACTQTAQPSTFAMTAAGGSGVIAVGTGSQCAWSAASTVPWMSVTSGQTGTGPGEVRFSVAPAESSARTGTIRVGTVDVTVSQRAPCSFTAAPGSVAAPAQGTSGNIQVTAAAGCAWTARSSVPWILVADAGGGAGTGQIGYLVTANTGPARQGTLAVAGHTIAVSQASGCTYALAAPPDLPAAGGGGALALTTGAGCEWSAASSETWVTVAPSAGAGSMQVQLSATPNNGPPRSATISVAGQLVTVNQASPCGWTFAPPFIDIGAPGGGGTVLVLVTGTCHWTAESMVDWIAITFGASGSGNGMVQMQIAPNGGPARIGIVRIAGIAYTVGQRAQ